MNCGKWARGRSRCGSAGSSWIAWRETRPKTTDSWTSCSRKRGRKALRPPGCAIMATERRWNPMETNAQSPGLLHATGFAEQLQRLEDAAAADVERIKF